MPGITSIERAAFLAWPAEENVERAGWQLRAMRGVTRRANSVYTAEGRGGDALESRIDEVEAFYSERGLPARFQISPASVPTELDAALAHRGYLVEAPVLVMTANAERVAALGASSVHAPVQRELSHEWFELSGGGGRYRGVEGTYRGLLDRLPSGALYALAPPGGAPAAVGLAVVHDELCGIFSMLTVASERRRGLAMGVLSALARAGAERGAKHLYLQVEEENEGARALYARAGFVAAYRYVYRSAIRAAQ